MIDPITSSEAEVLLRLIKDPGTRQELVDLAVWDFVAGMRNLSPSDSARLSRALGLALLQRTYGVETTIPRGALQLQSDHIEEVDYLVVAVKQPELEALTTVFEIDSKPKFHHGGRYWLKNLPGSGHLSGRTRSIAVTMSGKGGNTHFAAFLSGMLQVVRPRMIVVVGMGGARADLEISDVVVGTRVIQSDYGTRTPGGFVIEQRPFTVNAWLERSLNFFSPERQGWSEQMLELVEKLPEDARRVAVDKASHVRLRPGIIVSSDTKHEAGAGQLEEFLREQHPDGLMVEMEGVGLAEFAEEHGIRWLAFRGAADRGEAGRSKELQLAASMFAAVPARLFIESDYVFEDEAMGDAIRF